MTEAARSFTTTKVLHIKSREDIELRTDFSLSTPMWESPQKWRHNDRVSALNNLPPAASAKVSAPGLQRDGAPRCIEGSARCPIASPSQ